MPTRKISSGSASNDTANPQLQRPEGKWIKSNWADPMRRGTKWGALDMQPTLHADEKMIVLMYLRRYVTWCARRGQRAQMEGAAVLYREVKAHAAQRLTGSNVQA